jgi:hypothetical protein
MCYVTLLLIEVPYRRKYYVHFQVFSMLGFIVFPIDSDVSIMSVEHLDYSKIYLHYVSSDGSTWATVVFGWLRHVWNWNIYENGGPRDHWRQIQIAKTETLLGFFIYGLCVGLGVRGCCGGWRVWGGRVGSGNVLDVIPHLHIHA